MYPCARKYSSSVVVGATSSTRTGFPLIMKVKLVTAWLVAARFATVRGARVEAFFGARVSPEVRFMILVYSLSHGGATWEPQWAFR